MSGFRLSKRAMQVVIEPLDPAVQQAVQEVQRIAPETLMKVKKIVVHPSGGSGELGHVQMGPQNDPHEIHIFKSRIEQIARQQLGASGKQIDPKQLAEAVRMALIETISHEGAHIGGAKRSEEQIGKGPFFGEGEAEAKAKEVVQRERQLMPKKPASAEFALSKRAMVITREMIPTLWYENENGDRHILSENELKTLSPPPKGFIYQHSQFPTTLNHTILRQIVTDEVDACPHPEASIKPTGGWIDGVEGRECSECGGHQTKNCDDPWPEKWSADGSKHLLTGSSGWPEDLALAMANSKDWNLRDAILIAANSCERCMNALAHRYGLKWGYPEFGNEWRKCNTSCEFCQADPKSKSARTRFPLSRRAAIEMACPHCHENVSHLKPEKTPAGLYKMLTCPHCKGAFYPQDALLATKEKGARKTDIGEWPVFEWFAIDLLGMPLGYVKGETNANMMVDRIKREFAATGKLPEFGIKSGFIWRRLKEVVKSELSESYGFPGSIEDMAPELLPNIDADIDSIQSGTERFHQDKRRKLIDGLVSAEKATRQPPQDAIIAGGLPTDENRQAASGKQLDIQRVTEQTRDKIRESGVAGDIANRYVGAVRRKMIKENQGERTEPIDPSKMNDDRNYASFIPLPLSKRAGKKKRPEDLILEAALTLDGIRERHLPDAPMAEPDLRFVIKAAHASPDLVRLGLELLKDERLHPVSADIEDALEFNKTAVCNPNVARLLGAASRQLDFTGFGTPSFVTALAEWQDRRGLDPNGKLDAGTVAMFADLAAPKPPTGRVPRNFGIVIPGLVYRGGIIERAEQLEHLRDTFGVRRVISLHDNPDMARMCGLLGIQHVPAFMSNGAPEELGRKVLGDSVLGFIGDTPTYIHCFYGADRASSVVARIRTESGWPCKLAYAEAKAYGFKDMFADLIDWFSEPCEEKLDIDTDAIRKRMGDREPYENPELSQDLVEPAPTDLPFETSNSGWETYEDTIVNTFGIGSVPISESSHGW